jgi:hypothetical protein
VVAAVILATVLAAQVVAEMVVLQVQQAHLEQEVAAAEHLELMQVIQVMLEVLVLLL